MLVSIISSVYNCEKYVEEMINSILEQSLQDWEMILIDDASTDNTWNIISAYTDKRIIKIKNKANVGLTCNLNKALSLAKGKYIVRIDGDDIAESERLKIQVHFMENNPDVVVSGCNMQYFGMKHGVTRMQHSDSRLRVNLLFNSVICHPTFIVRKETLDNNEISYNEKLEYAQDYHLLYLLMQYGKMANISECLVKYRVHNEQITVAKSKQQQECANYTRTRLLKLLDIELDEKEAECWYRYCLCSPSASNAIEREMLLHIQSEILKKNQERKVFNENILKEMLEEKNQLFFMDAVEKEKKLKEKHLQLFLMMNQWVKIKQKGKNIADYLKRNQYKKIAVYGMGYVGETLLMELEETDIDVAYAIDRNKDGMVSNIKVVCPTDELGVVDAVVVTTVFYFNEIADYLKEKTDCPIISLMDILYEN